jgi:hypothetical protein
MMRSELPRSDLPQLELPQSEFLKQAPSLCRQRLACGFVDGVFLLSRHCGDLLAGATCLASQHLFSRSQFETARRTRSPFARRANDPRRTSQLWRMLIALGVVMSKDFWLTCACAEEVKRVIAASQGAGRPKNKIQNQKTNLA